ncbi:MAG TPA: VIT1/CCC1 transporter family protein [Acidobacteriota bacterium]|nr:VIT1/CCC1 transporter family protein [Acidobacteriota bacterium]
MPQQTQPPHDKARLHNFHAEEWHTPKGRAIREIIFGMNDGLITSLGFLAGVTGALADTRVIILAAMAEIAAGVISMSAGAYIASKSQREFFEKEIAREKREIEEDPEHESSEIRQIYHERGFTNEEIDILTRRITADKDQWLRFMLREELGLGDEAFEDPIRIGRNMGFNFLLGAVVPVIPYLFLAPTTALIVATAASILFLFALGAFKTRLTKRSWLASGFEMLLIGMGAAIVGYLLGLFVSRITHRF